MRYCGGCSLSEEHPGVEFGPDGLCSLCRLDAAEELLTNYRYTNEVYQEFRRSGPNPRGEFDCLFMYSGGKDSTWMLDRFVSEGKRVMAYTFDIPFESEHAAQNLELARERIPATFVLDSDDAGITRMMREVFNRPVEKPGKYLDEKLPCVSCRTFFVIRAIIRAYRERIPYIILCADPQQILTMESNVREVVRGFYRVFGERLTDELFRGDIEDLLFAEDRDLPKIVFPFIATRHEYDPDTMISELKAKGLYQSSPLETHCKLLPLLNYYSFKNYGCMFYKLNAASHVRSVRRNKDYDRSTFSIKFPRTLDLVDVESSLRRVVLAIAAGEGEPADHEQTLIDIFQRLDAEPDAARFVARQFLDMRAVAADMGIRLN
ncbi:hypothetical protein [Dactylosporangium sp. NPDC051484]|uniref:hypothetical protein n=1 Tax=Dactylosporangium sp. NPDC051484 TaxID=3154942 RepID=UPI00344F97E2